MSSKRYNNSEPPAKGLLFPVHIRTFDGLRQSPDSPCYCESSPDPAVHRVKVRTEFIAGTETGI